MIRAHTTRASRDIKRTKCPEPSELPHLQVSLVHPLDEGLLLGAERSDAEDVRAAGHGVEGELEGFLDGHGRQVPLRLFQMSCPAVQWFRIGRGPTHKTSDHASGALISRGFGFQANTRHVFFSC